MKALIKALVILTAVVPYCFGLSPVLDMDFNNDGKTDFAAIRRNSTNVSADVYFSTGSGFSFKHDWISISEPYVPGQRFFYGDFNGDGRTDIGSLLDRNGQAGFQVFSPSNPGKSSASIWTTLGPFNHQQIWFSGNFSSKTVTDMVKISGYPGNISLELCSKAAGSDIFTAGSRKTFSGQPWKSAQRFYTGDFTGDGLTDILRLAPGGIVSARVYTWNGTGFVSRDFGGGGAWGAYQHVLPGDFNGDKKMDFVKYTHGGNDGDYSMNAEVYFSDGRGFSRQKFAEDQGAFTFDQTWLAADFTGDGKADLVKIWEEAKRTRIAIHVTNAGATAFNEQDWVIWGNTFHDAARWMAGDFNGDGTLDLAEAWSQGGTLDMIVYSHADGLASSSYQHSGGGDFDYTQQVLAPPLPKNDNRIQACYPSSNGDMRTELNNHLNSGADLVLCQEEVYGVSDEIVFTTPNQAIYTEDAEYISQFGEIRSIQNKANLMSIDARSVPGARMEKMIMNGNRYEIGSPLYIPTEEPLMFFGVNSQGQRVQRVVMKHTRSWSTLKVHERGADTSSCADNFLIDNLVLGAGPDGRGNGSSENETHYCRGNWGDAFSVAGERTTIRNNLMLDPTDVGVATFCAPGSMMEKNVISGMSREPLGCIGHVDVGITFYQLPSGNWDYRNTTIRDNLCDSYGGHIHIGFPLGPSPWWSNVSDKDVEGGKLLNNVLSGDVFGYGIALNNIHDYTVQGNVSTAIHSGIGYDGCNQPADYPFYKDRSVGSDNDIQSDFRTSEHTLVAMLRANGGPQIASNRADHPAGDHENGRHKVMLASQYSDQEIPGWINAAFVEMLHRFPTADEMNTYTTKMDHEDGSGRNNYIADDMRRELMGSQEFIDKFGNLGTDRDALHLWRTKMWQDGLEQRINESLDNRGVYPDIRNMYLNLLGEWEGATTLQVVSPNDSAKYGASSVMPIIWDFTGTPGAVSVKYNSNGGAWQDVAPSVPGTQRSVTWTLPASNLDDVRVQVCVVSDPSTCDETDVPFSISTSIPTTPVNPVKSIAFTFSLRGQKTLYRGQLDNVRNVVIYDVKGSLIRDLPVNNPYLVWDGNNKSGSPLNTGVYFVRLVGSKAAPFKIFMTR